MASLNASRDFMMKLLEKTPDHKRAELYDHAVRQELALQESIRLEDYSASSADVKGRRFLAYFLACATVVIFLLVFLTYVGAAKKWGWEVNDTQFKNLTDVLKYSFVAWIGALVAYYFRRRR